VDAEYRLFDARAEHLGPYYVTFEESGLRRTFDSEGVLRTDDVAYRDEILQYGLGQHALWRRLGDERALDRFLAQARWASKEQRNTGGVRGSYGCDAGDLSATAQGLAISLLLRAYEETQEILYLERAVDASIPLAVDVRDGGVLWRSGTDVFFEAVGGPTPSHFLSGWIFGLWGLLELSRTAKIPAVDLLYEQSLATLEKYLPCYDTGSWSYESLLAAPCGFRRFASLPTHMLHVAQLSVMVSMTKNELFAIVGERWRRYAVSFESHAHVLANAVVLSDALTVPTGARSVV